MNQEINTYKQPQGLYLLFLTELWERFGFYTLQTIIILYMTKGLLFSDNKANLLYATFSSLLYLTPAIGGYIADRYLGFKNAIIIGGILLALGYVFTALPGQHLFFLGLSILICANGLFKPNVSSIVGTLYEKDDARRDGGFTLFYMGINIGSLIPPIFAGAVVAHYGWHMGFGFAAIGMVIALITFMVGKPRIRAHGNIPDNSPLLQGHSIKFSFIFLIGIGITIALCRIAFNYPEFTNTLVIIGAVVTGLVVVGFIFKESLVQRKKMIVSLILIAISIGFWSLYNQTFTSLTLFADRNMTQHFLGIPVDAEAMQFFNPFFIVALSPLLSRLWISLDKKGLNLSLPAKFSYGVLFMTLGFLVLALATKYFAHEGVVYSGWLVFSYFLQTIGELLISPIGLAMITVLSPPYLTGMMMGVWFFSQAASSSIAGMLANQAAIPDKMSALVSLPIYGHAFLLFGYISLVLTVVSFMLLPFLKKLLR